MKAMADSSLSLVDRMDADGIIWPRPLAPFEVSLLCLILQDPEVVETAESLYAQLEESRLCGVVLLHQCTHLADALDVARGG